MKKFVVVWNYPGDKMMKKLSSDTALGELKSNREAQVRCGVQGIEKFVAGSIMGSVY